jgi:hypothetical protein
MLKRREATRSSDLPNSLARINQQLLFSALERFVNLRDSHDELTHFRVEAPDFFPPEAYEAGPEDAWIDCLLCYKRWLRGIWRGDERFLKGRYLDILLGVEPDRFNVLPGGRESWLPRANALANWKTGELEYQPACDFQQAVYLLFKSRWRAKRCTRCLKCFIADKPAQLYCGTHCSSRITRLRNLQWWKQHGKEWRTARKGGGLRKARRSQQKRGK